LSLYLIGTPLPAFTQTIQITNDVQAEKVTFRNEKIKAILEYNHQADISFLAVNEQEVIKSPGGIYSAIRTKDATYSTLLLSKNPSVKIAGNTISLSGIRYGDSSIVIDENWIFTISNNNINLDILRTLSKAVVAEQLTSPAFIFDDINTWDGAYQDYGGLAWFYLFRKSDTYGVHSSSARFWNSKSGNGIEINVTSPDKKIAMDYSRTKDDKLAYTIAIASDEIKPRFDKPTYRRRFIRGRTDVWAPIKLDAGASQQKITLAYFDFNEQYGRGNLAGINGTEVSNVLNTIARIGVIDKNHFGGNSWHTPYGPICLHEQYIAQLGLAINDNNYLKGYQDCLDFYRDNAIKSDGRVWPRWAYTNEDAMPGAYTDKGFYEAQWGYLLDSNPDLVTNVAELYDQTGNKAWIKTHQQSCEKALDWILKRDNNNNGLVEMITDSMQQKRGSDWIDIIWASYENAFVNAKLYHALVLWAGIEKQLGNSEKEKYYNQFAQKLKASFNRPTSEGGFWDDEKECYVHWRDKDGSIHGRNMVTPVNFMAIGYGICDNALRIKTILDKIETEMQKEQLFFWPLCMYSYAKGEGNDWQFPFPNYENGDIFLSWGAMGVQAYASYKPDLALKYVKNVLAQYARDGLAFQRYGRARQVGLGDDILSGNSLSVVGLYQAIYGINPLYNRFYLNPHITDELAGTQVKYNFRNQQLTIDLAVNNYSVSNNQFKIKSRTDFGFFSTKNELSYFTGNSEDVSLKVSTVDNSNLTIDVLMWGQDQLSWTQSSKAAASNKLVYQVNNLKPNSFYSITINNKLIEKNRSDSTGAIVFNYKTNKNTDEIKISMAPVAQSGSFKPNIDEGHPKIVNIVNFIRLLEPREVNITEDVLYQTVVKQVEILKKYKLKGTFLLQYDALMDARYQKLLKNLDPGDFEIGAWWEIPQPLVEKAGLKWRGRYPWDWHADIGFTTGYTPEEREKLADIYMNDFRNIFGYYPESVGSWFIDAHTLSYLYKKYEIVASCNCKDQYGTDGYTLWGGYWNQAYYPSKMNSYMPAQHEQNQIPVPIFRMLGSDPIRQYDQGLGTNRQGVISLEPVYRHAGGDSTWVNWYFKEFVEGASMEFAYTQTGQENSFTWNAMSKGFEIQMPMIERLRNEKKIKVETLGASGKWFKEHYRITPPTSVTVNEDLKGGDRKTVWFNSRFYRINLLWENGSLRIRDIHLFNEELPSIYETNKATSNECSFFTLPFVDGYLWSNKSILAGLRFKAVKDGQEILLEGNSPVITDSIPGKLHISWPLKSFEGTLDMVIDEQQIKMVLTSEKSINWFLDLTTAENIKLPFVNVNPQKIECTFEGMNYSVSAGNGFFSQPGESKVFRITPVNNFLILKFDEFFRE
jgi:hypothetical protein